MSMERGKALEPCAVREEDLTDINRFARTPLKVEEVYCFALRLCDNEVDRDYERFDGGTLAELGDLFVGKTGVFDHQWSVEGQRARIYRTEIVSEPEIKTQAGDGYCWLKAWAYLLRTERNAELIREIEGGIKKEVSVGCSVKRSVCSVCGAEGGSCEHQKGKRYGAKLCYWELREARDAYEWSFVAVPAQRNAGVVKKFTGGAGFQEQGEGKALRAEAALGRKYLQELRREVIRLALLADDALEGAILEKVTEGLGEEELQALKQGYEARAAKRFPLSPQLPRRGKREETAVSQAEFRV